MNEKIVTYIELERDIKELEKFYKNQAGMMNSLENRKKEYLEDKYQLLNQILTFILKRPWIEDYNERVFGDWDPEYLILGHYFEGLLRTILMKESSPEEFFNKCTYDNHSKYKMLNDLITYFLDLPTIMSLTSKQQKRIKDLLRYIQIQRNQQAHALPHSWDTYTSRYHIYTLIEKIYELFQLPISNELSSDIKNEIDRSKVKYSLDYEPVW